MQRFKTLGLVTVVTAIVWIFAEGEVLQTEQVQVDVAMRSGSSQLWLSAGGSTNWSGRVRVTLEGPATAIDAIRPRLSEPIELLCGEELPDDPDDYSILLATALNLDQVFAGTGVAVIDTQPATLDIVIDELVQRPAIVEARAPGNQADATPLVETATVSIPMRSISRIPEPLKVVAQLSPEELARLVPGRPERVTAVPLLPPDSLLGVPGVSIEPAASDVRVTVRTQVTEKILESVFVQLREPPATRELFSIVVAEGEEVIRNVRVTGPVRLVEQIGPGGAYQPVAVLALTPEVLQRGVAEGGLLALEARIEGLPEGVSWDASDRTVRVTVSRREQD